jgi:hypothetical protein
MPSEPVTTPVDAGAVIFNAASTRGSLLSESTFAGMTTDTPMVIAVLAMLEELRSGTIEAGELLLADRLQDIALR